jgi:hypothetical protein
MPSLPYENATSGAKAMEEIHAMLTQFECDRFGQMLDNAAGELIVQFTHRGRNVTVRASFKGYAAALKKAHPRTNLARKSQAQWEADHIKQAKISVYSILRDWIKGQVMAVETGVLSFESAFLGQLVLANGATVFEHATAAGLVKIEHDPNS